MSETDLQLIERYRRNRAEEAFTEIVHRHLGLVYSAALRQVRSSQLAEEVAQSTFIDLARSVDGLNPDTILAAWLYHVTRRTAVDVLRREARRMQREQIAAELISMNTSDGDWERIRPLLDEAMDTLEDTDRAAVLLRYFEKRSLREVGEALGVSDDAAQKRVSRAVDQLRGFFSRQGVAVGTGALVAVLFEHAVKAAPASMVVLVSAGAVAGKVTAPSGPFFGLGLKGAAVAVTLSVVAIIAVSLLRSQTIGNSAETVDAGSNVGSASAGLSVGGSVSNGAPVEGAAASAATGHLLRFRVVSASTGLGIEKTRIVVAHFYTGGKGERHELLTDKEGWVFIPRRKDGANSACNVFASVEGYVPKAVMLDEKPPSEYILTLETAVRIAGIVTDELGTAVASVRLQAERSDQDHFNMGEPNTDFQTFRVETDAFGRWAYHYIPPDYKEVRIYLTREGYAVTSAVISMDGVAATNARLVIKRGFTVIGKVIDPNGFPVVGADVSEVHNWNLRRLTTKTGGSGEFMLSGISTNFGFQAGTQAQETRIVIQADGYAGQARSLELKELTNHVVVEMGFGRVLQGTVVDENGDPIPGATVRTDSDFDRQIQTQFEWRGEVNANGWFQWRSAPDETICYAIEAPGYEAIRGTPFAADGTQHRIVLRTKGAK